MLRETFLKFFPPPAYLLMRPLGFDISDRSIKYCALNYRHGQIVLEHLGEKEIPAGAIIAGQIKEAETVTKILTVIAHETGEHLAVASLPEEGTFTACFKLPVLPPSEIRQSLELQLGEAIPLPASGAVFDYEPTINGTWIVEAAPQSLAETYDELLSAAGFQTLALEGEARAIARAVLPPKTSGTVLLIDLGRWHVGLAVVVAGVVWQTSTINEIGGDLLTMAIQKNLGVTWEIAERLKAERGLLQDVDNKLLYALLPSVSVLRDEIVKFVSFWNTHRETDNQTEPKIEQVLLCGGQALMPGLTEYLAANLTVPVLVANPWINFGEIEPKTPPLLRQQILRYATVLGLGLRSLMPASSYD